MKLNVRAVASYSQGPGPADREGFLWKKGGHNPSYQRRWFVLRGNLLFYFERPGDRAPLGLVVLEGCSVQLCESSGEAFAFAVVHEGPPGLRVHKMAAEDQEGQEAWVKALTGASLRYIRLLVRDMEKQLKELCRGGDRPPQQRHTVLGLSPGPPPSSAPRQREPRTQSLVVLPGPSKCPRRSPKPWRKQPQPPPLPLPPGEGTGPGSAAPEEADGGGGRGGFPAPEDFPTLHGRLGLEVERLRRDWNLRRAEGAGSEPAVGMLIDLS
ncbi:sesquipedalian-1-like [Heptranchias perlo]|uniref:sesquipedalian-1-like n=1 Tax=Heptranchias perlo TaxID=212740 RepID=UPI0035597DC1